MKNVHKYTIVAKAEGAIEYDAKDPAAYFKALERVDAIRKGLVATGATITRDDGRPASVRE